MKRLVLSALVLLAITFIVLAETPDECAARLDQSIAIKTYQQAATWWATVQLECEPQPETASTPEPSDTCDPATVNPVGLYFGCGKLDFCVMTPTLNIRSTPGGTITGSLSRGDIFTIDRATLNRANGYVWGKHDKGWSAIEGFNSLDELPYPEECPQPTPQPTRVRTVRSTSQAETLRIGQTKTFQLSGADCAITSDKNPLELLAFGAGRFGWLQDEFMIDLYPPWGGGAMSYATVPVDDGIGQMYIPDYVDFEGYYTIKVSTFTESKFYQLQVTNKAAYNISVACE
ncbi:MAG: hypothetical protein OXG68_03150 [Chloroflexi bacterium]|nr:hypothetical protein [Chloroflexota bacterium]